MTTKYELGTGKRSGLPRPIRAAVTALKNFLTPYLCTSKPCIISIYGDYIQNIDADPTEAIDYARVIEVDVASGTGHGSFQRSNTRCLALLAACEDFLETYNTTPTRPHGWKEDLDVHGDAKRALIDVIETYHPLNDEDTEGTGDTEPLPPAPADPVPPVDAD